MGRFTFLRKTVFFTTSYFVVTVFSIVFISSNLRDICSEFVGDVEVIHQEQTLTPGGKTSQRE